MLLCIFPREEERIFYYAFLIGRMYDHVSHNALLNRFRSGTVKLSTLEQVGNGEAK